LYTYLENLGTKRVLIDKILPSKKKAKLQKIKNLNIIVCSTCKKAEESQFNEIVQCNACKKWEHQHCNGPFHIPKGDWFCGACKPYAYLREKYSLSGIIARQITQHELKYGGVGKFFSKMEEVKVQNQKLLKKNKILKEKMNTFLTNVQNIIVVDSDSEDENIPRQVSL